MLRGHLQEMHPHGEKATLARRTFFLAMLLPCVLPAEISTVIFGGLVLWWLATSGFAMERGFLLLVAPLLLMLFIGLLGANNHELYDAGKDVWYLGKAVLAIGVGYFLMQQVGSLRTICRAVVAVAVIAALLHLFRLALYYRAGMTLYDLRVEEGVHGYFVVVIGLALMLANGDMKEYLGFREKAYHYLAIVLCSASVLAALSRTELISLLLMTSVLRGWLRLRVDKAIVLLLVAVVIGGVLISVKQVVDQDEMPFVAKVFNSLNELTIADYEDDGDINTNWRGFESSVALTTYLNGSSFEWLFGQGAGTLVDLGFYIDLGGNELRYIPLLHNGYMYVLLKYGAAGLAIYCWLVFSLISVRSGRRNGIRSDWSFGERLVSSLGWLFLFTTMVISGIFNKFEMEAAMVLLGAAAAWVDQQRLSAGEEGHRGNEVLLSAP